ncbi:MAG: sugar ABC transporter ATP-binding protein [Candidatus Humimicrobiaceae bacterium]
MGKKEILNISNISKSFLGVQALKDISVSLIKGEIHALVGENGAGKSTLSKIICGIYENDRGSITFKDDVLPRGNPIRIQEAGIFMIPQDLGLIPRLSVMQNIFLGREKQKAGMLDLKYLKNSCREILDDIGIKLDLDMEAGKLSIDQQQFVALARVLTANAELIILDEPTSTLSEGEVETLFRIIDNLQRKGITIIYISHRLDEIFKIADRVTILKDGVLVQTCNVSDLTKDELINKMVGRALSSTFPKKREISSDEVLLSVKNISVSEKIKNVSFDIKVGEVLGIGGLVGMGQTAIFNAVFGNIPINGGEFEYGGHKYHKTNPAVSIRRGINYISSDRREEMIFINRSVKENISIATLNDYDKSGFLIANMENKVVDQQISEFNISASTREQEIQFLSGGNQQKSILARWLIHEPKILLLDEPTQGIDVGTKEDIYKSLRKLADKGIAIVVIFSDMTELLGMCDRIAVIYEGKLVKVFNSFEATEEKIMAAASDHYNG